MVNPVPLSMTCWRAGRAAAASTARSAATTRRRRADAKPSAQCANHGIGSRALTKTCLSVARLIPLAREGEGAPLARLIGGSARRSAREKSTQFSRPFRAAKFRLARSCESSCDTTTYTHAADLGPAACLDSTFISGPVPVLLRCCGTRSRSGKCVIECGGGAATRPLSLTRVWRVRVAARQRPLRRETTTRAVA